LEKNFFYIDLSKYRLITFFWNSLPMIFKSAVLCTDVDNSAVYCSQLIKKNTLC